MTPCKVLIIVQARMTSSRLPGKVLKVVAGKPLLEHLLERLKVVTYADALVVATTKNVADDPIVSVCEAQGIPTYRGSEHDVLARYYEAASIVQPKIIVRITSDCPLLDPAVVDGCIQHFLAAGGSLDYVCTQGFPRGLDCEVFSFEALASAYREASHPEAREHVTPYLYRTPNRFRLGAYRCPLPNIHHHRWTVDTLEDLELVSRILSVLPTQTYTYNSILKVLNEHADWVALNQHVQQIQLSH